MFDFLRVAGLATLALGAAGASGAIPAMETIAVSAVPVVTEPLPATPRIMPLADDVRARAAEEAAMPAPAASSEATPDTPASSLAALVRRHADSTTADAEQNCLASAIYFESKGEPLEGQLAVARVIMNRADSGRFARTLCGVVRQPGQFSFVRGGSIPSVRDNANWRTAVAIAKVAQNDLWDGKAENALFFHAKRVAPGWRMARVGAIGNHVFYR